MNSSKGFTLDLSLTRGMISLIIIEVLLLALGFLVPNAHICVAIAAVTTCILVVLFSIRPSYLLLLYLMTIPLVQHLNFHNINFGDFVVTPHMMFQFFLAFIILTTFLHTYEPRNTNMFSGLDKCVLLLLLVTSFSLVYPYSLPVNHAKRWLLFYTGIFETVTLYFLVKYCLTSERNFTKHIVVAVLATSLFSLVVAIRELGAVGFDVFKIFSFRGAIGFGYHNTNLFGIHSALLFPIAFYAVGEKGTRLYKVTAWMSLLILTVLSLLCFNRGTIIVMTLELAMLSFSRNNRKLIFLFVMSAVVAVFAFSDILLLYVYRFISSDSLAALYLDPSAMYRFEAWRVGLQVLFLHPFGVGAGGFQYAWQLYGPDPRFYVGTPHQLFLSIGVDYGILALGVFFTLLILTYRYASVLTKIVPDESLRRLFRHIKISLAGFVAYGMITDGELSHLTGFIVPNNGYTLIFFTLVAVVAFHYTKQMRPGSGLT